MRLFIIIFIISSGLICVSKTASTATVTNEDIRDAILSLMHSYNVLDNKLERHEMRERSLGETIKRGLVLLQKGQRPFESTMSTIQRLDDRIGQIETLLINQEERVSNQQIKLADALEAVLKWMTEHTKDVADTKPAFLKPRFDSSDEDSGDDIGKKVEDLSDSIKLLRQEIGELKADKVTTEETSKSLLQQAEKLVNSKLASADEVVTKLEEKLSHFYVTSPIQSTTLPPTIENTNIEWENNITKILMNINDEVKSIKSDLNKNGSTGLNKEFFAALNNETLEAIEDMRLEVLTASDKSFTKTSTRIKESSDGLKLLINELQKSIGEAIGTSELFRNGVTVSYESLRDDIKDLSKLDKILLQTSDNVLDTKRRIEYGVHQILLEMGDLIKLNTNELNKTIDKRFTDIDITILENHRGALSNLSSKIETEMSQVWRQIGVMYQEISSSKLALDRLQEQTESYVNGTLTTMDSMEGKVSQITGRIAEVDSNLNFFLGRLSLISQEFNNIKLGLGDALDSIKSSFQTVQEKIKDVGPGPHNIPENVVV